MTAVGSRREQILAVAAQLFARHGFHGVSIADLGAAVGVSGPALYRHFPGKEALLAELLVGISEHLLAGGRERAAASDDPDEVLAALVAFQAAFALREPELIVVQDRDLANLPRRRRRRCVGCSAPTSRSGWTRCAPATPTSRPRPPASPPTARSACSTPRRTPAGARPPLPYSARWRWPHWPRREAVR
jgi:AcrR family transcriptional regulator